jgi:6,7-dimethyl-8-ribityllumazine synthase
MTTTPQLKQKKLLAVVTAEFNIEVTEKLEEGALGYFKSIFGSLRTEDVEVHSFRVPGAFEIPIACNELFKAGFEGVVALGAVIRGETTHYDMVCRGVTDGVMRVSLDWGKPIAFGVLTTENEAQAFDRVGGANGHKGKEAAEALMKMLQLQDQIWQVEACSSPKAKA